MEISFNIFFPSDENPYERFQSCSIMMIVFYIQESRIFDYFRCFISKGDSKCFYPLFNLIILKSNILNISKYIKYNKIVFILEKSNKIYSIHIQKTTINSHKVRNIHIEKNINKIFYKKFIAEIAYRLLKRDTRRECGRYLFSCNIGQRTNVTFPMLETRAKPKGNRSSRLVSTLQMLSSSSVPASSSTTKPTSTSKHSTAS